MVGARLKTPVYQGGNKTGAGPPVWYIGGTECELVMEL